MNDSERLSYFVMGILAGAFVVGAGAVFGGKFGAALMFTVILLVFILRAVHVILVTRNDS